MGGRRGDKESNRTNSQRCEPLEMRRRRKRQRRPQKKNHEQVRREAKRTNKETERMAHRSIRGKEKTGRWQTVRAWRKRIRSRMNEAKSLSFSPP